MCWERSRERCFVRGSQHPAYSLVSPCWSRLSSLPWWLGLLEENAAVGIPQGACHDFPLVFVLGEMKVPVPPAAAADAFSAASPRLAPVGWQLLHKQGQLKTSPGSGPGICCDQPQTAAGKARLEPRGRRIFEAEASKPPGLGGNAWHSPSLEGE